MKPGLLRFLLAGLVLLHHSSPLRLGNLAVYLFFTLSGYWIARIWDQKYAFSEKPVLTFMISRWLRLAPVFMVCSAGGLLLAHFMPHRLDLPKSDALWLLRQLPIIGSVSAGQVMPPTWSLDVEMRFYLCAALILPWLNSRYVPRKAIRIGITVLFVIVGAGFLISGGDATAAQLLPWVGFFLAGILLWRENIKPTRLQGLLSLFGLGTLVILVLVIPQSRQLIFNTGAELVAQSAEQRMHANLFSYLSALLAIPLVGYAVTVKSGKFDRFLGNWAYPLYLFHWIPRTLYYQWVDWSQPFWVNGLLLAANFSAALVGAWVILLLIDRPSESWRTRWLDARIKRTA